MKSRLPVVVMSCLSTALAIISPPSAIGEDVSVIINSSCAEVLVRGVNGSGTLAISGDSAGVDAKNRIMINVSDDCLATSVGVVDNREAERVRAEEHLQLIADDLRAKGVSPERVDESQQILENGIRNSPPELPLPMTLASDAEVDSEDSNGGGDDLAVVAGMGAAVAACMVVSAGACAAVVAILPSLFGTSYSKEEVEGVTKAITNITRGEPLSDADISVLEAVGEKVGVNTSDIKTIIDVASGDPGALLNKVLDDPDFPQNVRSAAKALNEMMTKQRDFNCSVLLSATGNRKIQLPASLTRAKLNDAFRKIENGPVLGDVTECLDTILVGG